MPIFWNYLLKAYFRVFLLSISGFVALLLVTRLKEIARFAVLSSSFGKVLLFTLYQIPHILPIAIPISCLISSILLFQSLSENHILTALRMGGLSLLKILAPLLFAAFFLFLLNLFIGSELTSRCRFAAKECICHQSSENPIVLLQRQKLLKIKNAYIDMKTQERATSVKNLLFISYNKSNERLNLFFAQKLFLKAPDKLLLGEENILQGENLSLLSYFPEEMGEDALLLENQAKMKIKAETLSHFIKNSNQSFTLPYLPLRLLFVKASLDPKKENHFHRSIFTEVVRRFSLAFSAFTFTFLGASFGMEIGRNRSRKKLFLASLYALAIFVCFLMGKALKNYPLLAMEIYLLPQIFILFLSIRSIKKLSRGIE